MGRTASKEEFQCELSLPEVIQAALQSQWVSKVLFGTLTNSTQSGV